MTPRPTASPRLDGLVNGRELAAAAGVCAATITKYRARGVIRSVTPQGASPVLYALADSLRMIAENRPPDSRHGGRGGARPGSGRKRAAPTTQPAAPTTPAPQVPATDAPATEAPATNAPVWAATSATLPAAATADPHAGVTLAEAQRRKVLVDLDRARLQLEQLRGTLLDRTDVETAWAEMLNRVRMVIDQTPVRWAGTLAAALKLSTAQRREAAQVLRGMADDLLACLSQDPLAVGGDQTDAPA